MKSLKKVFGSQIISIYLALVVLVVLFSIMSPTFHTVSNALTIIRQIAALGIMALGMMFALLLGNVDLSVGAQVSLLGISMAHFMVNMKMSIGMSVVLALLISLCMGLLNGIIVTYCKIPALIATLGTQMVFQGISYTLCNAMPISGLPETFSFIGQGYFMGIPIPIYILIFCCIGASFVFNKTSYGRTLYCCGSNKEAARLSGIRVNTITMSSYIICAIFTWIAAVIYLSRVFSGQAATGLGQEMNILIALVLGGVSFHGGAGQVSGVVAGLLILGVIQNGMVMLNVGDYVQLMVRGIILIGALSIDPLKALIASYKPTVPDTNK